MGHLVLETQGETESQAEAHSNPVEDHCFKIMRDSYVARSDFDAVPSMYTSEFLLGKVAVFKLSDLRASDAHSDIFASPLQHLGAYRLARYLDIAQEKPVNERGFFSWNYIYAHKITIDPDIEEGQDDDLMCISYNNDGQILGHLGIAQLPKHLSGLPMDPSKRNNDQLLELEQIFGDFIGQDPELAALNIDDVRVFTRYSRVSRVPGVPKRLNGLAKGKIATHLITTGFKYMRSLKNEGVSALIFDGERHAARSIELMGLAVKAYDVPDEYRHVPKGLKPRYLLNRKSKVQPHAFFLDQLDRPDIVKLHKQLENNSFATYLKLVVKQLLVSKLGALIA